jgi:hypothetical protein
MSVPTALPSTRLFAALMLARAAFGLAFLAPSLRPMPLLWYQPLVRAWTFELRPSGFAMEWFGRTALAIGVGALVGVAAWAMSQRGAFARWLARPGIASSLAHAGALVLLVDFFYFGWVMTHQTPAPLPLPAWYCPR